MRAELGVDIAPLGVAEATELVREAEEIVAMRVERDTAAVTRGIVAAFGGGD